MRMSGSRMYDVVDTEGIVLRTFPSFIEADNFRASYNRFDWKIRRK